ncbi:MAG: DUF4058 family protein [Planctomycetes bacterium]|nr:DUF4058 family protein [Planctomycetota bacterium]
MDPYLEAPGRWPNVHHRLVSQIAEDLQPKLLPDFFVGIGERVYVEPVGRVRGPDVFASGEARPLSGSRANPGKMRGASATLAQPEWVAVQQLEVREPYLFIQDVQGRQVVTVLEVLSPSNKRPGPGRREYLQKQQEVLASPTNLVEIDLLRGGTHTVAVPEEAARGCDYRVCVRRTDRPGFLGIVRFDVREPLMAIPVPIGPGVSDVILDLPGALAGVYEKGAFHLVLDYSGAPDPPLAPDDARWAEALLTANGLRSRSPDAGRE